MLLLYTCIIILTWLSSDRWRNHLRRWAYRQLWLVILFINSGFFPVDLKSCSCWCFHLASFVLHLTKEVRNESQVIGKVEIVELRQEWPLYTNVPVWCFSPHDPVNYREKEKWWQQTCLSNTSNYRTSCQHGQTCMPCLGRCCGSGKGVSGTP